MIHEALEMDHSLRQRNGGDEAGSLHSSLFVGGQRARGTTLLRWCRIESVLQPYCGNFQVLGYLPLNGMGSRSVGLSSATPSD
jgi:hypothetical protein